MSLPHPSRQANRLSRYHAPICRRCGSTSGFHPVEIGDNDTGCLMLMFGGLIPFLIYDSSRRDKIECESCGLIFCPVKRFTLWDFIGVVLFLAVVIGLGVYILLDLVS
jgi:hypothetical protein